MEALYVEAAKATTKLVITRPLEQLKSVWGIKDQLEKLKKEFIYIQALLQDIENLNQRREADSQLLNAWLEKVTDLAYLADNLLDDYNFKVLHKKLSSWELKNKFRFDNNNNRSRGVLQALIKLKKRSLKRKCGNFLTLSNSNPLAFRFQMSRKVEHILKSFDDLYKDARKLGIRPAEIAAANERGVRERGVIKSTISNSLDEGRELAVAHRHEFVGRKLDQQELRNFLCDRSNNEELSTIAIVGMGGLGKTTLARQLYENEAIVEHFTERFWICISDKFSVKRVFLVMFEKLTGGKCELSHTEHIIQRVQQLVRGKKYLLVLDDVWDQNQNKWTSLKKSLRRIGGATGSMILVTTRDKGIVKAAESRYMHQLAGLTDKESWAFFVKKAFPKGIATYDLRLEEIGRKIVKKCKGLPLAIDAIGGLLRMKEDLIEWENIENSTLWNLPQEDNIILPSLLLSFNNLPSPSLKQCFAYCAIYPKEVLINREDLINLWNAQGFLHCQEEGRNLTPEELGGKYVDILLNNSLLQADTRRSCSGYVTEFRMHYLVHEIALYISRNDWLNCNGEDKVGNPKGGLHLALFEENDIRTSESPAERLAWLRTLHSTISLPMDFWMHTKNLRVLKLAATGLEVVPPAIGRLNHLRYIDLSHNPIVRLPESITSLYHLQTFRLFGYKLMELPQKLHRLVNLRHLHLTSRSWCLPRGIEQLTAIQTLPMLELSKGYGWEIAELGALGDIKGLLSISGLEHVKSSGEAEKAGIWTKVGISEMQLTWGWGRASNHLDVLDALQPPPNLKLLMITGYDGSNFPSWMMSMMNFREVGTPKPFYNLVHIELLYCSCQQLPAFGHLPSLCDLSMYSLWSVASIRDEFYHCSNDVERTPTAFPALRKLNICSFENLTKWEPPIGPELDKVTTPLTASFPVLEMLRVEECENLVRTPTNFPSLRHLRVDKSLRGLALYSVISNSRNALTSLYINEASELSSLPEELIDCKSLEELTLRRCPDLQSLPNGLGSRLSSLLRLSIVECPVLREIPVSMGDCLSLKKMCIRDCHNLEGIPDLSQLIHVEEVEINGCGKLTEIATSMGDCLSLKKMCIRDCHNLKGIPNMSQHIEEVEINGCEKLTEIPASIGGCLSLKKMCIRDCHNVEEIPDLSQLLHIEEVEINGCKKLTEIPGNMGGCLSLRKLCISDCHNLEEIPELSQLIHIEEVEINGCKTLKELPASIGDCLSLKKLCIRDCQNLEGIPDMRQLIHIEEVEINGCKRLAEIPTSMGDCLSLKKMCICACPNLEGIPNLSQLIHIEEVEINGCKKLSNLPRGLQILPHLNSLSLGGFTSLDIASSSTVTSQHPFPALKVLRITNDDCAEQVPDWVGNVSTLQKLELKGCKNLWHLPSQKMTSLTDLIIESCPLLQKRYAKKDGPEWDIISHIRLIRVNSKTIQDNSS